MFLSITSHHSGVHAVASGVGKSNMMPVHGVDMLIALIEYFTMHCISEYVNLFLNCIGLKKVKNIFCTINSSDYPKD